jgi:hypothetical protein
LPLASPGRVSRGPEKEIKTVITLSIWETFIVQAGVSLLSALASKVHNKVEQDALQSAIAFLQKLLSGDVATA